MGIAARQRGRFKPKTQDRLRGRINVSDADKRGADFERLKPEVLERDNYTCQRCFCQNHPDRPTTTILTVHHIIPVARGGQNIKSNLITLCNICHSKQIGSANKKGAPLLKALKGKSLDSNGGWGDNWRRYDK